MSAANSNELAEAGSSQSWAKLAPVRPVPPQMLAQAIGDGDVDPSSKRIRDVEWLSYIGYRRGLRGAELDRSEASDDLTGIALSGGGIRSATFALGVLQALAKHDLLRRFDYLSTVSGGGYIGTSLTWLTSRPVHAKLLADKYMAPEVLLPAGGFGVGPSGDGLLHPPFPYGSDDPRQTLVASRAEGAMLRYLRQRGNYLTPGKGITLTSVITVLLRSITLNLLVWIPIIVGVMWFSIWTSLHWFPASLPHWLPASMVELVDSVSPPLRSEEEFVSPISPSLRSDAFMLSISPTERSDEFRIAIAPEPDEQESPKLLAFGIMRAAAIVLGTFCVLAFVQYSLVTRVSHKSSYFLPLGGTKYEWRRRSERWIRVPLWTIAALLLVASVPLVAGNFHGVVLGSSFSLVGLTSGILALMNTAQQQGGRWSIPSSWIASSGTALLLYGILMITFTVAYELGLWVERGSPVLGISPSFILLGALLLALLTGSMVDLNLVTLHRFYRDRLMEAFLPDVDRALRNETAPARQADSAVLSSMCDRDRPIGPYHIINTNLVLTHSDESTYRQRGGDSFILSPLYCGSNATGWKPTREYMGNELTLPTAMAISGTGLSERSVNIGFGGTINPLVSILMALLNLRFGFWVPNPRQPGARRSVRVSHFTRVLKRYLNESAPLCQLKDGGDFDDLGLYELIRRRLRLIVVCDGTAHPGYALTELQNAVTRIEADFGARVEFDSKRTLKRVMPSSDAIYPEGVRLYERAYGVAQIIYADGSTGCLVYLKPLLFEGASFSLMGYKDINQNFPDRWTADHFIDEVQFEAYRQLGYEIADSFIRHNSEIGGGIWGSRFRAGLRADAE